MKKFLRMGAFMLLIASLMSGMTACSDDDPDYSNVVPPTVPVAPNTLTGVVTSISGEVISGATITLSGTASATATTDNDGVYTFNNVAAGSYTLKAEATGKQPQEASLTVTNGSETQNLVWNAVLPSMADKDIPVSTTEVNSGDITSEHLKGNDLAGIVIDAEVPADAVSGDGVSIKITPIYTADSYAWTRATEESTLLVGATLSCSQSNAVLNEPVKLSFNLDAEFAANVEAKEYKNGQWVAIDANRVSVEDGKVTIEANEFTAYGIFLGVTFSVSTGSESISFEKDLWDNLYGTNDMKVENAVYTYKVGTEFTTQGSSVLTALLIEKVAQLYGATVKTVSGTYPINVTLPIGTALKISGKQQTLNISASARNSTVKAKQYGTVTIKTETYNRIHNGGSNN